MSSICLNAWVSYMPISLAKVIQPTSFKLFSDKIPVYQALNSFILLFQGYQNLSFLYHKKVKRILLPSLEKKQSPKILDE